MNVTLISGTAKNVPTGKATERLAVMLKEVGFEEVKEWYAPFGMNGFCDRCMTCVREGEGKCRFSREFMPIWKSMTNSDLIVFVTPSYSGTLPAAMKNLLEHLHFAGMSHRPDPRMFGMKMLVIQTGEGKAYAEMIACASEWGVGHKKTAFVSESPDESELRRLCDSALTMANKKPGMSLSVRFAFASCKKRVAAYPEDSCDKKYWYEKGWLNRNTFANDQQSK